MDGSFIAIDFETTGFEDGMRNDPWQLGAAVVEGGNIVAAREWFFGTAMTPDNEPFEAQWEEIHSFLLGRALVAHNISTERTILTRLAPLTKWGPWTDTLRVAKKRYPRLPSYRLGDLCAIFGCVPQIEGRTWHDGLFDAVACANLALKIA
jgi:DNA polymerase III epsilon subunit-like protein